MAQQAQVTIIDADVSTVCLIRDATLGVGACGEVCKATLNGKPCAAKLLQSLVDPNNLRKLKEECRFLSEIRHPQVVQYLGVAQDEGTGSPVLLMELMEQSLTDFLGQSEEPLAYHVQVNISNDIALAVAFLHSKGIVHRDLSSNNVLLRDGKAKVTNFGKSKLDSHMTGLTKCPGTAAYMAPEALLDPPVYTEKLDCFQVGVLMIQIITRKFPDPRPAMNRERNPTVGATAPISEVERRQNHLSLIPQTHHMLCLAKSCLNDKDSERPSAQDICNSLSALKEVSAYCQSLLEEKDQLIQEKDQLIQQLKLGCSNSVPADEKKGDASRSMTLHAQERPSCYYDILLLGRTGLGKSTTGNMLLDIDNVSLETIRLWGEMNDTVKFFKTGDGVETVTKTCKLLSNLHNVRVLDTPGFADLKVVERIGVLKSIQNILQQILQEQEKYHLRFQRILYFLPFRGTAECVEAALQEEIKVMYDFFGRDIFKVMVIIATNDKKHKIGFDKEDTDQTKRVFTKALEHVTGFHLQNCPPILYLPYSEIGVLSKIKSAEVILDQPITLMRKEPKQAHEDSRSCNVM